MTNSKYVCGTRHVIKYTKLHAKALLVFVRDELEMIWAERNIILKIRALLHFFGWRYLI